MSINYRKATKEDKKNLYDMGVALNSYYAKLPEDITDLFWEGWETEMADEVDEELKDPLKRVYIAEDENKKAAGYLVAISCVHCKRFEVDQLYVNDDYRGQKVGKGLMDLALKEGSKDHKIVSLEVYKSNLDTIKFYQKYGFKEDGFVMRMNLE